MSTCTVAVVIYGATTGKDDVIYVVRTDEHEINTSCSPRHWTSTSSSHVLFSVGAPT